MEVVIKVIQAELFCQKDKYSLTKPCCLILKRKLHTYSRVFEIGTS